MDPSLSFFSTGEWEHVHMKDHKCQIIVKLKLVTSHKGYMDEIPSIVYDM